MEAGFTRAEKGLLRKLAETAYARELSHALLELDSFFADWRAQRIDGFALSAAIHDFHQGIARELWSRYQGLQPELIVRLALEGKVLKASEVPVSLRARLGD